MIDENLQAQLRAKYNPKGSILRQHQLRIVKMLKYFDKLCKDNNIKYWLSSGSCLGAVRHKGFIPWDDDMDIEMLREDYMKLEKVFKETDNYILQTWKNDRYYSAAFAKIRDKNSEIYNSLYKYRGVFIDIFIIEKIPRQIAKLSSKYIIITNNIYNKIKKNNSLIDKTLFLLLKFTFYNITNPLTRSFVTFFNINSKSDYRHTYGTGWIDNIRDLSEILPTCLSDFEGLSLPIPHDYDKYLRRIYGNYMQLPDENNIQVAHSEFFKINT